VLILHFILLTKSEIIDYTSHEYLLFKDNKRGVNEIGTVWKWLAGTPDHDDFIKIQNKIDELIKNNNKQFIINSKLFKEI